MVIVNKTIKLDTDQKFAVYDLTEDIKSYVRRNLIKTGNIIVYVKHTTAAITINEYEVGLLEDMKMLFTTLTTGLDYRHDDFVLRSVDKNENVNGPAHMQAMILGSNQSILIVNGRLDLGRWQHILFVELDGPRKNREVSLQIIGSQ